VLAQELAVFPSERCGCSSWACTYPRRASRVFELWNEPHNFTIRPRLGGDWVWHPPSPWVNQYLAMVRSAVEKVKAYDPSVKLLSCDDMWAIHYWFLATGLPQNLDGFAFHPYAQPVPEMAAVDYNTDWATLYGAPASQIVHMVDQDRSFRSACRRLRERARSTMGREPELWIMRSDGPCNGRLKKRWRSGCRECLLLPRHLALRRHVGFPLATWLMGRWALRTTQE
jgi:hypothetical protein